MKLNNVLSLFDGLSCGQLALQRAGITFENYYASEIDKYAILTTQKNFPNTIQLGDVTKISAKNLPKIDLLIGGFPCPSFSVSGKQKGFDDDRGKLFFEVVRLLRELKPKYFLFENVKMKKEYQDFISKEIGVEPILIDSSLLSAQNRKRLYWTNIPNIQQPKDLGLKLKDILETSTNNFQYLDSERSDFLLKIASLPASERKDIIKNNKEVPDVEIIPKTGDFIYNNHLGQNGKLYKDKAATLVTSGNSYVVDKNRIRKLTPIECERLQTMPDNFTSGVSDTQRYKMIGNAWTVDVIAHIFRNMK